MNELPNIKKELKKMQKHLEGKPDGKLIDGYRRAMKAYENTGDIQHKHAADFIKKELDRRKIKVD